MSAPPPPPPKHFHTCPKPDIHYSFHYSSRKKKLAQHPEYSYVGGVKVPYLETQAMEPHTAASVIKKGDSSWEGGKKQPVVVNSLGSLYW